MQAIEKFNIRIVDTIESNRELIFEDTQVESPRLIYNGQDDKFANLNTTELHFNLLVKTNDDAVFFHLFTGAENRFKVILEDVTDPANVVIHWEGFLLPEQFSEPFTHSNFFVEFVATDGIGLLKNRVLAASFYADQKSVLDVIQKCLLQTGLNYPLLFAPAVQNANFELNYLDLEVNTASYLEKDDKKSSYDILIAVLESIGCKLFQYQQQWIVVGINLMNATEITFSKYTIASDLSLQYVEEVLVVRNILRKRFYATPSITVLSPLKTMTTTWDADNTKSLIPEDVVSHYPVNINTDINDRTVKYWQKRGAISYIFQVFLLLDANFDYTAVDYNAYYNGLTATPSEDLEDTISGPFVFFNTINTSIVLADLTSNYIDLQEPFFVEGSSDLERFATLEIHSLNYPSAGTTSQDLRTAIEDEVLNGHFFFAVTRKDLKGQPPVLEEFVLSNFDNNAVPDGTYDFKLTISNGAVKAALKIDKMLLEKDGYYNIRLYPAVSNWLFSGLQIFTKCSFELEIDESVVIENERNIGYTTSHELEVFHSGHEMTISKRRFIFSEAIQSKIDAGTLTPAEVEITPLFFVSTPYYAAAALWYTKKVVGLSDSDYYKFKNGYQLFIQKAGSTLVTLLDVTTFSVVDNVNEGGKIVLQLVFEPIASDYVIIEEADQLILRNATDSNYAEHWVNRWRRVGVAESASFLEILNRIYLGLLEVYNFRITGNYIGFLTPMDLVSFHFKGERFYSSVKAELNLTEGTTEVTLVECKYTDINIDPLIGVVEDVVIGAFPSISITAEVVVPDPAIFSFSWSIAVRFTFTAIAPVNTFAVAKQLTGTGGAYTGVEKSVSVSQISGTVSIGFPIVIGTDAGFYEVSIMQDGIISNIVEVEVAPVIVLPTERIDLAAVWTGDVFNITGTYSINYVGFTPIVVTEYVEEIDIVTQQPVGTAVATVIGASEVSRTVAFSQSGSYRVTLVAEAITSNAVAWLSIQI